MPIVTDEEPQQPGMLYANGNLPNPSLDAGFGTLVNGLRQSAQPPNKTELPKAVDLSAQLSSILGVQPTQSSLPVTQSAANVPSTTGIIDNSKANDLLALLQLKSFKQPTQQPQTPIEQVVEHPPQSRSPPHPHHQPPRLSNLPPRPTFLILRSNMILLWHNLSNYNHLKPDLFHRQHSRPNLYFDLFTLFTTRSVQWQMSTKRP